MKKIFTVLTLTLFLNSKAQEPLILQPIKADSLITSKRDTSWKTSGFFGVNFSQTALSNWQGGGQDNLAGNAILNLQADYKKGKYAWVNKLDAQFGVVKIGDSKLFKKNIDQIFALSKYEIKAFSKYWFYAVQADFRSQFAPGYTYSDDGNTKIGTARSDFNSPSYTQLALGLDYKPADYFSITFAPVAAKLTVVNHQYLADEGAYGVKKADTVGNVVTHGKKSRFEGGGRIIVRFKKDIFKNINLDSYLDLFSNYAHNPGNIDVVFNNLITFRINKYFTANIISQMIYDDDIIIKRDWNHDGKYDNKNDINGPRLQLLTTLSIGFGYKF